MLGLCTGPASVLVGPRGGIFDSSKSLSLSLLISEMETLMAFSSQLSEIEGSRSRT